ncbi:MAG TPA: DUF3089 domain-containing protein [Methanocorpusculum sp.]|nr:DUF3089 domain-containing protein [Methanocorpusculum sp.]HJK80641.1 DUF3089 domain-containing protein [Methanocorpusculum sp.]
MNTRLLLIPALILLLITAGCITAPHTEEDPLQPLDYAQKENWAYLPDPAEEKPVDVFYLYPTLFRTLYIDAMNTSDPAFRHGAIDDVLMKKGVFAETANIYAPFYRQTGLYSMLGNGTWTKDQYIAEKRAYEDVKAAFLYYLENYNNGKPFILAGHSQGSYRIKQLMIDLFVDPDLQDKLIAAYPIGYTISEYELAQYPQLKAAAGKTDTGVIVTYNTQGKTTSGKNTIALPGAIGINPLNWKTDTTYANASENAGAVFFYNNGSISSEIPNFTGAYLAEVDGSVVLIADSPDPASYSLPELFADGVYHVYDYYFFYENLKENVADRTAAYFAQHATA